jgi:hypothetical protein
MLAELLLEMELNQGVFMKTRILCSAMAVLGQVFFSYQASALPVTLGPAGPGNWAVLEIGSGNVSIANASNAGFINGNVGVANGTISDSGTPIVGNVVTLNSVASTLNPNVAANVTGSISQNAAMITAAVNAANAAAASAALLGPSGGGVGVSVINFNDGLVHNLTAGVYNLTGLTLQNGTKLNLTAGGSYVFNISGTLALNSSQILAASGLSESEILFNIIGSQGVQFSGGLAQESVLHGIILAPNAQIGETPGLVVGEIISGGNINIASGAQVQGIQVPDAGSSTLLLSISLACLFAVKRKFLS